MSDQTASPVQDAWTLPQPQQTTTQRAMMVLVLLAVAGTCFLISAPTGMEAGHQPWRPGSILHPITELMTLYRQFPTRRGVEVKWLVQGVAAAAAVVVLTFGWWSGRRRETEELPPLSGEGGSAGRRELLGEMDPPTAAQIAWVLFGLWMLASALWAVWPAAAFGEGLRQIILITWAICLGRGLSRTGARQAAIGMMVILVITAVLGIWYHFERNPQERLKFPIGNPIFLAACLVPGITLAGSMLISTLIRARGAKGETGRRGDPGAPSRLVSRLGTPEIERSTEVSKTSSPSNSLSAPPSSAPFGRAGILSCSLRTALITGGLILALVLLLWALRLTDSRGPMLGLPAGVMVTAVLAARGRLRLLLLVGTLVAGLSAWVWFQGQLEVQERGRGATTQFRLYAWRYAFELFLTRPDIGKGQGSYVLLAQQMSRADAEKDPTPFPAVILGHAHNEWLEILADLGAAGFALCATALGLTLWCAVAALRRISDVRERWCLLGLVAALAALIVQEASSVGLRMPGLPLIFYTTIGLIWALGARAGRHRAGGEEGEITRRRDPEMERSTEVSDTVSPSLNLSVSASSLDPPPPSSARLSHMPGRAIRHVVLAAGILAGAVLLAVAVRDWEGALADTAVRVNVERQDWEQALLNAGYAGRHRLSIEDFVSASDQAVRAAHAAAVHQVQRTQAMAERGREPGRDSLHINQLAREDAALFDRYFSICLAEADTLLRRMPAYPDVAGLVADLWLARQALEIAQQQLRLRPQAAAYVGEARQWMRLEYLRDVHDADNAIRLFQLSQQQPLAERLNLLRVPLRRGPVHPATEPALLALMQEPEFGPVMNHILSQAKPAVEGEVRPEEWPERYIPETLRLAALAHRLQGNVGSSVALATEAARLLEQIDDRFPRALAHVRIEQARYLLLAAPQQPELALEAAREAIAVGPRLPAEDRAYFQWHLVLYNLAAGDEDAARAVLRERPGAAAQADLEIEHELGYAYAELYQLFAAAPPNQRPPESDQWLGRVLELVPDWPMGQLLAARQALEHGQSMSAVYHLQNAQQRLEPQQMLGVVQSLMAEFPDDSLLQAYNDDLQAQFSDASILPQVPESVLPPERDEPGFQWPDFDLDLPEEEELPLLQPAEEPFTH